MKGNTAVRFSVAALIGLIASACASGGEGLTDQSGAGIDGPDGLSDVPSDLDWKDTSPGWSLGGQKLLLTGTIYVSPGVRGLRTEPAVVYFESSSGETCSSASAICI